MAVASIGPPALLGGPTSHKGQVPARRRISSQAGEQGPQSTEIWSWRELTLSPNSLTDSVTCGKLLNIFKAMY